MTDVLVVDDADVDRLLISGLLGHVAGFNVLGAENGIDALKKISEWPIDIIITDMQMPEMDGLKLVEKIRQRKLEIPIILTTGVGSEEIAAEALLAGAAGYIPKNKLNEMLVPTINRVLEIFNGEQHYDRLLERTKLCRYEIELENDPELIPSLVDFCERILISSTQLDRIDCLRMAVAVDHAVQNAMYRGNLEIDSDQNVQLFGTPGGFEAMPLFLRRRFQEKPYCDRKVELVIEIKPDEFTVCVRDEGPGFDTSLVGDLNRLSTRGTNLISAFMDSVKYSKRGNEVEMRFKLDRSLVNKSKTDRKTIEERKTKLLRTGRLVCQRTGDAYDLNVRKFVIGRGTACHLKIGGDKVSQLHCVLVVDNGIINIVNLSADYETLVNDRAVKNQKLKDGDVVGVGTHSFKFEAS